jgi:hypothetical protein
MEGHFSVVHETDWLGSNLVFFNAETGVYSPRLKDLTSKDSKIHKDGLESFLRFGFAFQGQTPFDQIKFTLPNQVLLRKPNGDLVVEDRIDPVITFLGRKATEHDAIEGIREWIRKFYDSPLDRGDVTALPLSGGFDSRMLAYFSQNRSSVRAFSYGTSLVQKRSHEVKIASRVAAECGLRWNQIQLGDFHDFLDENDLLYGASTHAHSMYHFEFFTKIREFLGEVSSPSVLSGIYGDVWAGSWEFDSISGPEDVRTLSTNHGIDASSLMLPSRRATELEQIFWEKNKDYLKDPAFRIISAARIKMVLIRHLLQTPSALGFRVYSPFLDLDIAMSMLLIDKERRRDRLWQKEFLNKAINIPLPKRWPELNALDMYACYRRPPPKLSDWLPPAKRTGLPLIGNVQLKIYFSKLSFSLEWIKYKFFQIFSGIFMFSFRPKFVEHYSVYMTLYPFAANYGLVEKR